MGKLKENQIPQRIVTYVCGLFCSAVAVNLFVRADLGNSAVTTAAVVFSQWWGLSLGTCTLGVYCLFVVAQILILRRDFQWRNLGQVPFAMVFSGFVDLVGQALPAFTLESLVARWLVQGLGMLLVAVGTLTFVGTELVPLPVEGFLLTMAKVTPIPFHKWKMCVDCSFAGLAIVSSLLLFGQLVGVGVGTIVLAIGVGWLMGIIKPHLPRRIQNWQLGHHDQEL